MSSNSNITYSVRYGPSLESRNATIVAEYDIPFSEVITCEQFISCCRGLIGDKDVHLDVESNSIDFRSAVVVIAKCFLDFAGPCELDISDETLSNQRVRVLLGFYDAQTSMQVCDAALRTAFIAFAPEAEAAKIRPAVVDLIRQTKEMVMLRHPDLIARALIQAAHKREIPVSQVEAGSRTWRYGQGSAGVNFIEAANENDSITGVQWANNKFQSNQVITRLGLPGVMHAIAGTVEQAQQIAKQLGYPVVVKPISGRKGQGITANIINEAELQRAFAKCKQSANQPILIERAIPGDDHRIVVIGGKFKWAVRRRSPRVMGDGQRTIRELLAVENKKRTDEDVAAGFVTSLAIDNDMETVLAKQGLGVDDIPQPNRNVMLRSVANTATGGTIEDISDQVHPDNIAMVETLARAFQLDTVGVDYITTDISESWCHNHSAIIEVNTAPGFSSNARAEMIIDAKFAPGSQGRIPVVGLIDCAAEIANLVIAVFEKHGLSTGYTDNETTRLGQAPRVKQQKNLASRINSLTLDPGCDGIVFSESTENIQAYGFPMDQADLLLVGGGQIQVESMLKLLGRCAPQIIDRIENGNLRPEVTSEIEAMLVRYAELGKA